MYTDYSMVQYNSETKEVIRSYSTKYMLEGKKLLVSSLTRGAMNVYRYIYQ